MDLNNEIGMQCRQASVMTETMDKGNQIASWQFMNVTSFHFSISVLMRLVWLLQSVVSTAVATGET